MASKLCSTGLFDATPAVEEVAISQQGIHMPGPGTTIAVISNVWDCALDPAFFRTSPTTSHEVEQQGESSSHAVLHWRRDGHSSRNSQRERQPSRLVHGLGETDDNNFSIENTKVNEGQVTTC